MDMDKNLVSLIILSYNNLQYISNAIDSVLSQNYSSIELIIGDDCSDKFDVEFYTEYINKYSSANIKNVIVYRNENNLGTVKNLNKAISLCNGEYIKFVAADDELYKDNTISQIIDRIKTKEYSLFVTNVLWCNEEMEKLPISNRIIENYREILPLAKDSKLFFKKQAEKSIIPAPGTIFKRDFFEKHGNFDEEYVLLEDWPTMLKISRMGEIIEYIDIISMKYRVGSGISTSKEPNPIFKKDYIRCIENEILPYKNELGYWTYKKVKYNYIRQCSFKEYSKLKKLGFIIMNLDIIIINRFKIF